MNVGWFASIGTKKDETVGANLKNRRHYEL